MLFPWPSLPCPLIISSSTFNSRLLALRLYPVLSPDFYRPTFYPNFAFLSTDDPQLQ